LGRPAQSLIDVSLIQSPGTHPQHYSPTSDPHSPHGEPENLFSCVTVPEIFLSKKLPHGLTAAWRVGLRIPNLGALPIIASVSLTHIPCLCACFGCTASGAAARHSESARAHTDFSPFSPHFFSSFLWKTGRENKYIK